MTYEIFNTAHWPQSPQASRATTAYRQAWPFSSALTAAQAMAVTGSSSMAGSDQSSTHQGSQALTSQEPLMPVLAPLPALFLRNIEEQHSSYQSRSRRRQRRG
jgi:hypothetical protein